MKKLLAIEIWDATKPEEVQRVLTNQERFLTVILSFSALQLTLLATFLF